MGSIHQGPGQSPRQLDDARDEHLILCGSTRWGRDCEVKRSPRCHPSQLQPKCLNKGEALGHWQVQIDLGYGLHLHDGALRQGARWNVDGDPVRPFDASTGGADHHAAVSVPERRQRHRRLVAVGVDNRHIELVRARGGQGDSVPETDAPLFVSVTTPDPTLAGSTGSEKFTVTGVVNGTFRAPFAGLTATTVGGVGATPSARAETPPGVVTWATCVTRSPVARSSAVTFTSPSGAASV